MRCEHHCTRTSYEVGSCWCCAWITLCWLCWEDHRSCRWGFPLTRWECKGRKRLLQHCTYKLPLHRCSYTAINKPNADCNSKAWRFCLFFTWLFFFHTRRQIKPALMPWEECENAGCCSNDAVGKVVIDLSKFAFRVWSLHKNPQWTVLSGSGSGSGCIVLYITKL